MTTNNNELNISLQPIWSLRDSVSDYIYIVYIIQEFIFVANFAGKFRPDIGATSHITTNNRLMFNVENVSVRVIVGDGKEVVCTKRGDVLLNGKNGVTLLLQ